ncbi:hypothetical protein GUJ93_ZPchr0008g11801 [Zizania palustris]|uniref:Protein kinase domain-containing protein n=1 Tax=Zizania palustris TaxID=103762 RepID=A0A8J5RJM9_ZIZPA|nr:hypothetical protein GUJ93_ZPchr0008g11801 [Zizania palustris]
MCLFVDVDVESDPVCPYTEPLTSSCSRTLTPTSSIVAHIDSLCVVSREVGGYLTGGTLTLKHHLINHYKKKLAYREVVKLALGLAKRLSFLHSKKTAHRNVKTEKILLDSQMRLKIADFSVARVEAENPKDMTGTTGTLGYMAPEVFTGLPYNRKCDVYSFGICLWEIYCCDMSYPDLSFVDLSSAIVNKDLRPEIPRCCPSEMASIMRRCWDANPDVRPEMDEEMPLTVLIGLVYTFLVGEKAGQRAYSSDDVSEAGLKIFQRPASNEIYDLRAKKDPPFCKEDQNKAPAWYTSIRHCLHKAPVGIEERGSEWPEEWPKRVETFSEWLGDLQTRVAADHNHWKAVVEKSYFDGLGIDWSNIQNVLDMKAVYIWRKGNDFSPMLYLQDFPYHAWS